MYPSTWSPKPLLKWIASSMLAAGLMTCASKSPRIERRPGAADLALIDDVILVDQGESSQASLSPRGNLMLFVSARRPTHASPQIYERDMSTTIERRVTFQNGRTASPRYANRNDVIIYASSTDEEKENFAGMLPKETSPPTRPEPYNDLMDIYVHRVGKAFDIERVTNQSGFDGEAHLSPDGKFLTWTRVQNNKGQILVRAFAGGPTRVRTDLGTSVTEYVSSPDAKIKAWLSWDSEFKTSQLKVRRAKDTINVASDQVARKSDLTFTPDSKFLLWSQFDPERKHQTIWAYDLTLNCTERFVFGSDNDRYEPVVTPDMKFVIYTLKREGHTSLAEVPFAQRSGPCR